MSVNMATVARYPQHRVVSYVFDPTTLSRGGSLELNFFQTTKIQPVKFSQVINLGNRPTYIVSWLGRSYLVWPILPAHLRCKLVAFCLFRRLPEVFDRMKLPETLPNHLLSPPSSTFCHLFASELTIFQQMSQKSSL